MRRIRSLLPLCAVAMVVGALTLAPADDAGASAVIAVPGGGLTIQAAIDAASSGDAVVVGPGVYVETLNFRGKSIEVRSSDGPGRTIIDGGQQGSVVTFISGEGRGSVIRGFTIRNGYARSADRSGGGIRIYGSSPSVVGNVITGNNAEGRGGGIAASFSSALIQDNAIMTNGRGPGTDLGAGVYIGGAGSTEVVGNTITDNDARFGDGGGVYLFAAGTPTLRGNFIARNRAHSQGGGIWMVNRSDALITDNVIRDNVAGEKGGGVYWLVPGGARGPFLIHNSITGNAAREGSGIFAGGFQANAVVADNYIEAHNGASAVACGSYPGQVPHFANNTVVSTGAPPYSGCGNIT